MRKLVTLLSLAVVLTVTGCKKLPEFGQKSEDNTPTIATPIVVTEDASDITTNSAVINGSITNWDGNYAYNCQFVWGTTEDLSSGTVTVTENCDAGYFSISLTDLTENTTYYYKACAIISGSSYENAVYGEVKSFTTGGTQNYSELIVGRWCTTNGGHYEVYNSDGTGKMWEPAEGVQEDEADTFNWTIEGNHMMQTIHFTAGQGDVPQYCNIIELNETTFKYNNEAWRAEFNMTRVN